MKIAISAETTADLTKELIEKYDIRLIPYEIVLGNKVIKDGDISLSELFEFVEQNKTLPHTTAINEFCYAEYFEELLKEYDAVVHITLSSGLTSSVCNAVKAAEGLNNVFVVDSNSLSTGIGLLSIYARELADKGYKPNEIAQMTSDRSKKIQASFIIERLDYLFKGGRCNSLQLLGANILKIRPRIVLKDGKMISDKKYRGGMGGVVAKYCQDVFEEFPSPDLDKAFITYSIATEEMIDIAKKALLEKGFKNIYETNAGITIASHCGENTLGIFFFNDGE